MLASQQLLGLVPRHSIGVGLPLSTNSQGDLVACLSCVEQALPSCLLPSHSQSARLFSSFLQTVWRGKKRTVLVFTYNATANLCCPSREHPSPRPSATSNCHPVPPQQAAHSSGLLSFQPLFLLFSESGNLQGKPRVALN